jgi:hypothetical protein
MFQPSVTSPPENSGAAAEHGSHKASADDGVAESRYRIWSAPEASAYENISPPIRTPVPRARSLLDHEPAEAGAPETPVSPPGPIAPGPGQTGAMPTLQSILAEIGRRQQELECDYQAQKSTALTSARAGPPSLQGVQHASTTHREPGAEESIHLSIGSIVVRVEPELVAPPQPPRPLSRPPHPERDTSNRWARSFLDR